MGGPLATGPSMTWPYNASDSSNRLARNPDDLLTGLCGVAIPVQCVRCPRSVSPNAGSSGQFHAADPQFFSFTGKLAW